MKINCTFSLSDRLLPLHNMNAKHKPTHAQLSIGSKPSLSSSTNDETYLMICTAKNRSGNKYPIKGNVLQIFTRFVQEGKATIRLRVPEHDIVLSKCDPLELKCFINVLKQAAQGLALKKEYKSTLVPASAKDVTKAQTRLTVTSKKDYPLTSNFPKTLETLVVNSCNLKRFDVRILQLRQLSHLDMRDNLLRNLPSELSRLALKSLNLSKNQIETIHDKVFTDTLASSLQVLDLSDNSLVLLPRSISKLTSLVRFIANRNKLRYIHHGLVSNRTLKFFQASHNELTTLPADFTRACLDELDLFGNPLQNGLGSRFERLEFPTLVELASRTVRTHNLPYTADDLPRTLIYHLEQSRPCLACPSCCFQTFARISINQDLRQIARDVVRLESGYGAQVDAFLCSVQCLKRYEKNPLALWRR